MIVVALGGVGRRQVLSGSRDPVGETAGLAGGQHRVTRTASCQRATPRSGDRPCSASSEPPGRTARRISASARPGSGIEHSVHVVHDILKLCLLVINRFIHPQLPQKRLIPGGGCPDYVRSLPFCELNGETAHASGRAMNQHFLAFLQASGVK